MKADTARTTAVRIAKTLAMIIEKLVLGFRYFRRLGGRLRPPQSKIFRILVPFTKSPPKGICWHPSDEISPPRFQLLAPISGPRDRPAFLCRGHDRSRDHFPENHRPRDRPDRSQSVAILRIPPLDRSRTRRIPRPRRPQRPPHPRQQHLRAKSHFRHPLRPLCENPAPATALVRYPPHRRHHDPRGRGRAEYGA